MRSRLIVITSSLLFLLIGVWLLSSSAIPAVKAEPQAVSDDEFAYIDTSGVIRVVDPKAVPGTQPFTWNSPGGGWTDMTSLDTNGDGVAEILAIGSGIAKLFAPHSIGAVAPTFTTAGAFNLVTAGDFDGDGRDEILLQRSGSSGIDPYSVQIWDGNPAGTSWTKTADDSYGAAWLKIQSGDLDGLVGEEIVMLRNGTTANPIKYILIRKLTSIGTYITIFENTYNFPWIDLAIGNTHVNNGNLKEIVLTRGGVLGTIASFLVLQYANNQLYDAPYAEGKYYPYFQHIALGDVNASGDDEVMMVRDPGTPTGVSMLGLNWGADSVPAAWELPLGQDLKNIVMGDFDADGKAELLVARAFSYRIFWDPDLNLTNSTNELPLAFRSPVILAVGNFDGSGINVEPAKLAVAPKTLNFAMKRGGANPTDQTLQVSNVGGGGAIAFEVTKQIQGNWLDVTPFDDATPATLTVSINGDGLNPGTYNGTITVKAVDPAVQQGTQVVSVKLVVQATGPELSVTPANLSFAMNYGGLLPATQNLSVRNIGDGGSKFFRLTVTTDDGGYWLKTDKTAGNTDAAIKVSIDPTNLAPGNYTGKIKVDAGAITGSPKEIPVTLSVTATGMIVTPNTLFMQADVSQPSPRGVIMIDQAAAGSGAITWYAYAVPAGDWSNVLQALSQGEVTVRANGNGLSFAQPNGVEAVLETVPWVILTPPSGITPRQMQVTLDMSQVTVGEHRVTILVDGGPGTPNRFQGVDMRVLVSDGGVWLPLSLKK